MRFDDDVELQVDTNFFKFLSSTNNLFDYYLLKNILLFDTVSQEAIELLEMELEREKEERKRSEKRMRAAESAVIEIKNDRLLDEHDNVSTKYGLSFNIIKGGGSPLKFWKTRFRDNG